MDNLGESLIKLRKAKNLTQEQMGKIFNVSAQAVSKWEKGRSEPDIATLLAICKFFNVSLEEILGVEGAFFTESNGVEKKETLVGDCNKCNFNCDKTKGKKGYSELKKSIGKGCGFGAIVAFNSFLFLVIYALKEGMNFVFYLSIIGGYLSFCFVAQLYYSKKFQNFLILFTKPFKIFDFILKINFCNAFFLVLIKIFLLTLSGLPLIIVFLFGITVTYGISGFSFPFTIIGNLHKIKSLK